MIHSFLTPQAATEALATRLADYLSSAPGTLRVVLPGGATPQRLYHLLVREPFRSRVPWDRIQWILSDERCVPPTHKDSNYGMVWNTFWSPLGIAAEAIIRFKGELEPKEAVDLANGELEAWTMSDSIFDLVLLGVGDDGHTASIFPSPSEVSLGTFPTAHVFHPVRGPRLTLVPEALSRTKVLWFFALGKNKARAIQETLASSEKTPMIPISYLHPPKTEWFLDQAAATYLPGSRR